MLTKEDILFVLKQGSHVNDHKRIEELVLSKEWSKLNNFYKAGGKIFKTTEDLPWAHINTATGEVLDSDGLNRLLHQEFLIEQLVKQFKKRTFLRTEVTNMKIMYTGKGGLLGHYKIKHHELNSDFDDDTNFLGFNFHKTLDLHVREAERCDTKFKFIFEGSPTDYSIKSYDDTIRNLRIALSLNYEGVFYNPSFANLVKYSIYAIVGNKEVHIFDYGEIRCKDDYDIIPVFENLT